MRRIIRKFAQNRQTDKQTNKQRIQKQRPPYPLWSVDRRGTGANISSWYDIELILNLDFFIWQNIKLIYIFTYWVDKILGWFQFWNCELTKYRDGLFFLSYRPLLSYHCQVWTKYIYHKLVIAHRSHTGYSVIIRL